MPDKPIKEKFYITNLQGERVEVELPESTIDPNAPSLLELQRDLLRLKPGETLKRPHEQFASLTDSEMDLACMIANVAILNGCNAKMDEVISENPKVYGYVFTRQKDVPLLNMVEPEGGVQ